MPEHVTLSPQTHQSALAEAGAGVLAGTVTDVSGSPIPAVTVRAQRNRATVAQATSDATGRFRLTGLAPATYDVTFSLSGFRTLTSTGVNVSGGMESLLNPRMEVGSMSENAITMLPGAAGGGRGGRGSTVFGLPQSQINTTIDGVSRDPFFSTITPRLDAVEEVRARQQSDATAAQLGDLFEYKLKEPVTIRKNQSALVPILSSEVQAEKVSLWNPSSASTRALRAVWLTNATGLTLDGGSFSVIEGQAFAGEGLIEPLKAGEKRLLSYALDLAVTIDAKGESVPARVTRVQVSRGVLIQHTEERQRRAYSARNEDAEARTIVIEHPARAGWEVGGTMKPAETTPTWLRYRVTVAPKTTVNFTVEETRPTESRVSISSITDDHVGLLVREKTLSGPLEAALREVVTRKTNLARLGSEIARRQGEIDQIGRDQERVRENMRSLRGSSEERQLLQRYVKQLDDQETTIERLRRELQALTEERAKAQADLNAFIDGITQ
jgi:hypothetical protein